MLLQRQTQAAIVPPPPIESTSYCCGHKDSSVHRAQPMPGRAPLKLSMDLSSSSKVYLGGSESSSNQDLPFTAPYSMLGIWKPESDWLLCEASKTPINFNN